MVGGRGFYKEELEDTALVMSLRSSYNYEALELAASGGGLSRPRGQRDSLGSRDPGFALVFDRPSSSWPDWNFGEGRRTSYFGNPLWEDGSTIDNCFYYENMSAQFYESGIELSSSRRSQVGTPLNNQDLHRQGSLR